MIVLDEVLTMICPPCKYRKEQLNPSMLSVMSSPLSPRLSSKSRSTMPGTTKRRAQNYTTMLPPEIEKDAQVIGLKVQLMQ